MKRKDIGIIILVGLFSALFSFILSGILISTPEDRKQQIEVAETLSTDFAQPDPDYFNSKSINPAQKIQVGQDPNSKPFEAR